VLGQARQRDLLSDEHFAVDGTLIEAWAGHKSFKRNAAERQTPPDDPGNPSVDFHGESRTNATHQSTTDPEARLTRKGAGKEAKLSYAGHVLMENRNGLAVDGCVTQATGRAGPEAALALVEQIPGWHRVTLGGRQGLRPQGIGSSLAQAPGNSAYCAQAEQHYRPAHRSFIRATRLVSKSANGWKRELLSNVVDWPVMIRRPPLVRSRLTE